MSEPVQVSLATAPAAPATKAELPAMENIMQSANWARRGRLDLFIEFPHMVFGAAECAARRRARAACAIIGMGCHACALPMCGGHRGHTPKDGFLPSLLAIWTASKGCRGHAPRARVTSGGKGRTGG